MAARFSIAESQKNRCSLEDVISYIYVKSLFPKKGRGFFVCGCLCALLLCQHLDGLVAYLDDCHRARQTGCVQRCNACGCNDRIELYAIRAVENNLCTCFCTFHVDGVALCLYQNRNSLHFCHGIFVGYAFRLWLLLYPAERSLNGVAVLIVCLCGIDADVVGCG